MRQRLSTLHSREDDGRSGEIRTPDPLVPNQMRYQAALHSEALRRIRFQALPRNP